MKNHLNNRLQLIAVWSLLTVFAFSFVVQQHSWWASEEHDHQHQEEACKEEHAEKEVDACHAALFHAHEYSELKCDHEHHVSEGKEHCELCDLLLSNARNVLFYEKNNQFELEYLSNESCFWIIEADKECFYSIKGRSPPYLLV